MKIVLNSSVLIILDKVGKLHILRELFDEIVIPEAVYKEVSKRHAIPPWIKVKKVKNSFILPILKVSLHSGEAEAIILAVEEKADFIALDDLKARKTAKRVGLNVIGTIGILLLAKKRGIIKESIEEILELLMKIGFYISERLKNLILRLSKGI